MNVAGLASNIDRVREDVAQACLKCGRSPQEVTILAATKTISATHINLLVGQNINVIGENRVQELLGKYDEVDKSFDMHFIGHLQTNKVKQIVGKVSTVQSVDSLRLLECLDRVGAEMGMITNALLQVNIFEDTAKFGFEAGRISEVVAQAQDLPFVKVRGLMTMAAFECSEKTLRKGFSALYELFIKHNSMDILSMGMSDDFRFAVMEGSTLIRLGSSIFSTS